VADDGPLFHQEKFGPSLGTMTSELAVEDGTGALTLAASRTPGRRSGTYVSMPAKAETVFSAVLASWHADIPVDTSVDVAFRFAPAASGPWSRWEAVGQETEVAVGSLRRYLQFRVRLVSENRSAAPRLFSVVAELGRSGHETPAPQGLRANLPRPQLTTRAGWGARAASDGYTDQSPTRLIVHHSSSPTQTSYQGTATIRGIQNYHMDNRHWLDIGYHFLIGPDGVIYEGRPETAVGAHCIPNPDKLGICVIGNFHPPSDEVPTAIQRTQLVQLLAHLAGKHAIAPSGIQGHREYMSTDCPGQKLFDALPEIRVEVQKLLTPAAAGNR
jgi:hypothetical protein